jgi:hypothetical protein
MGNHLHEVLDQKYFRSGESRFDLDARVSEAAKRLRECAHRAVCFDLGDARELAELDSPALAHIPVGLPFDVVWFEFVVGIPDRSPAVFGVMCDKNPVGDVWFNVFARINREWNFLFIGLTEKNMTEMSCDDNMESILPVVYHNVLGTIRTALCAMVCVNINRIEHKPPEKLQKSRAKRGKKPLFSYWTLDIDLPKSRAAGEDYGGTHASPRLHLRRGHPRQFAPGKYCLVQPCVVGNKASGMVHKDYAAKYQ